MDKNITNIVLYHSLIVFGELLIVIALIHMLYKRRSPASMISWLLSMILLPYLFVVLYFIFGSRKRKYRYKKAHIQLKTSNTVDEVNQIDGMLRNCGVSSVKKNQEFKIFTNPTQAYCVFMDCIEKATKSIYLSAYVLKYDKTMVEVLEALGNKAQQGVVVKLLIDSLGSWQLYFNQYHLKKYIKLGIDIEFFMPALKMPLRNYINLREHRKIYIFDEDTVLSGGINLADEYLGPDKQTKRWEDMLFSIKGDATKDFFKVFASDWSYASCERLKFEKKEFKNTGDTNIQIVPSGPDMEKDALYEALLCAIYGATKYIWIVTPYFVPNDSLSQALVTARHRGVDVKLITPKNSNHIIADLIRSSFMRDLEDEGVDICLYKGNMLHAKAIIADDMCAILGSVNFDNRSLFLNYEVATFVYTKRIIKETHLWMKTLLLDSEKGMDEASRYRIIMENFMRIFAPQV
ncbi:MAG: phospholipase D-like domain-containing protein [Campylobacteraceae bacterium]|nr:phospholipase D-like domain-containing protein [Campylobacteraceae bacterium]